MKATAPQDISIGGPGLAAHAPRAGLVDECRFGNRRRPPAHRCRGRPKATSPPPDEIISTKFDDVSVISEISAHPRSQVRLNYGTKGPG